MITLVQILGRPFDEISLHFWLQSSFSISDHGGF